MSHYVRVLRRLAAFPNVVMVSPSRTPTLYSSMFRDSCQTGPRCEDRGGAARCAARKRGKG